MKNSTHSMTIENKENNINNDLKYIVNQSSLSGRMHAIKNYFSGGIAKLGSSNIALTPLQTSVLDKPVKALRVSFNLSKISVLLPALLTAQISFASIEDYKPFLDTATTEMDQIVSVVASQTSTKDEKRAAWVYLCFNPNMYYVDTLSEIYLNYPITDARESFYVQATGSFEVQQRARVLDMYETNLNMFHIDSTKRSSVLASISVWGDSMYTNSIYFDRKRAIDLLINDYKNTNGYMVRVEAADGLGRLIWNTDTEIIDQVRTTMLSDGDPEWQWMWETKVYPEILKNDPKTLYKNELPEEANHDTLLKAAEDTAKEYFAEIRSLAIYNLAIEGVWTKKQDTAAIELLEKINPALAGGAPADIEEVILDEINRVYPIIKARLDDPLSISKTRVFRTIKNAPTNKRGYTVNGRQTKPRNYQYTIVK